MKFPGVFIRAPRIKRIGKGVEILGKCRIKGVGEIDLQIPAFPANPANGAGAGMTLRQAQGRLRCFDKLSMTKAEMTKGKSEIVMARQENILVSTFHPELTNDKRVHEYFVGMVSEACTEK